MKNFWVKSIYLSLLKECGKVTAVKRQNNTYEVCIKKILRIKKNKAIKGRVTYWLRHTEDWRD